MNYDFFLEQAWNRINYSWKDTIVIPADQVSSNSVDYRELLQDRENILLVGCFPILLIISKRNLNVLNEIPL